MEVLEEIPGDGFAGLHFDGFEPGAFFGEQVDLALVAVAPEVEGGLAAGVEAGLEQFGDDHIFKKGAFGKMRIQLFRRVDIEQRTGKAGIVKIEPGRFDNAFIKVAMIRRKQKDNKTGWLMFL